MKQEISGIISCLINRVIPCSEDENEFEAIERLTEEDEVAIAFEKMRTIEKLQKSKNQNPKKKIGF